jgi:hypothetical protein
MATAERHLATADDRAWGLFLDALDAESKAAMHVPPGAAIVSADAPDRHELVRRYQTERRPVVLVHEDGRTQIVRPHDWEGLALLSAGALLLAWLLMRSSTKLPA